MKRGSGILLHITSLPSAYGIGDLGPEAVRFADFLSASGQRFWQVLPLNPTGTYLGNSPYTSYSVFAGNPLLISPELLMQEGYLSPSDLKNHPAFPRTHVDFHSVVQYKSTLFRKAFHAFQSRRPDSRFEKFIEENASWIEDYSLFAAFKDKFEEVSWDEWPVEIRDRNHDALETSKTKLKERIDMSKFFQFIFAQQWSNLREYCNSRNIQIIGDIPIYPSFDSSDAWAHPEIFKLAENREPLYVAGAPPDYFSATGQRWGNPVYDWDQLKETRYVWWIDRIRNNLKLCDIVRIDHFRGFVAYWEIPANEETAVNGQWIKAPAVDFFNTVKESIPDFPLIVEDLGLITDDVREVMTHFQFPAMKVLLFAFGWDLPTNPYAPHNYTSKCVVYTGTHDNNTIRGWYETEATEEDKQRVHQYLGHKPSIHSLHWEMIRLALGSTAELSIVPMQDVLGLGAEARMNLPSRSHGNWGWRLLPEGITPAITDSLLKMTKIYGRAT